MGNLGSATDILYFNKVMSSTMHWPYLGVIIVQKIPSESLQYNSTTVFMTCNEMAATVSCRHGSHTQVSTLPYPPTGQSPCISMSPYQHVTGDAGIMARKPCLVKCLHATSYANLTIGIT